MQHKWTIIKHGAEVISVSPCIWEFVDINSYLIMISGRNFNIRPGVDSGFLAGFYYAIKYVTFLLARHANFQLKTYLRKKLCHRVSWMVQGQQHAAWKREELSVSASHVNKTRNKDVFKPTLEPQVSWNEIFFAFCARFYATLIRSGIERQNMTKDNFIFCCTHWEWYYLDCDAM